MAHTDHRDVDRWVDERLATLTPTPWQPDSLTRLAELHRRRAVNAAHRLRWVCAVAAVTVVCMSLPVTRAFGARCMEACVNATTRVSQWLRPGEPESPAPRVVGPTIGDIAPNVVGRDLQGASVHLASFRGRVVVLNFWATWCGPCITEIPILSSLQTRFGAQDVVVVGVSMDADGWAAISPFAAEHHITYPLALADDEVAAAFGGVNQLPATFIIDRDGRIVIKRLGLLSEDAEYAAIAKLVERIR